jgi:hypothetical protein
MQTVTATAETPTSPAAGTPSPTATALSQGALLAGPSASSPQRAALADSGASQPVMLAERAESGLVPYRSPAKARRVALPAQPMFRLGSAAILSVASAACGAVLYARWQRQRNSRRSRLRRAAIKLASRL